MHESKQTNQINKVLIDAEELRPFAKGSSLLELTKALLNQQKATWELLKNNYEQLDKVEIKTFSFGNFELKVQFNPGRIKSSTAKVDKASIKARKCFLCLENLPQDQRGILFNEHYLILANPYPIFKNHYTIPALEHKPQLLKSGLKDFLSLAKELGEEFVVFYNGPRSGASAPDHFHFQAGEKSFLPLYSELEKLKGKNFLELFRKENLAAFYSRNYLRNLLLFESPDVSQIIRLVEKTLNLLGEFEKSDEEPMINVLSFYKDELWKVVLLPREKHRPDYYFKEGKEQILFSPAAVDLGGVCITPREEDFHKMSKEILTDALRQVTLSEQKFVELLEKLEKEISSLLK